MFKKWDPGRLKNILGRAQQFFPFFSTVQFFPWSLYFCFYFYAPSIWRLILCLLSVSFRNSLEYSHFFTFISSMNNLGLKNQNNLLRKSKRGKMNWCRASIVFFMGVLFYLCFINFRFIWIKFLFHLKKKEKNNLSFKLSQRKRQKKRERHRYCKI